MPDWYEIEYYGALTNSASFDGDGDEISLINEYNGGTHPLYGNTNQAGGVFWADSGSVTCNLAGYATYVLRSVPAGTVNQSAIVPPGTVITSASFAANSTFGYWTLDGVRQQDEWGVAYPQVTFTVRTNNRDAVAYFFSGDSDGDGVLDRYEQYYFGTLTNSASSDADGDGSTLAQEYASGAHPLYANSNQPGGVFWADSTSVTCNLAGYSRYSIRSEPAGTVQQSATVTNGTVLTTPSMAQPTFGFWTLDGLQQRDAWGVALRQFSFTVTTNDREAVAWLFAGDSDADGIEDGYEQYFFGTLTNGSASDTDGDGVTLAQEFASGSNPRFGQSHQDGGVFWQDSGLVLVDLQPFDRVEYTLIGGVSTSFFSRWSTNVTGFQMAAATAPALRDWDGDGDFDLFVGASNGAMRIFENAGSPVVPNLVERSSNFAALAWAWSGAGRSAPALGDWSGDGRADLVVGGDDGMLRFARSTGHFRFPQEPGLTGVVEVANGRAVPAMGDLDGDGRADLLVLRGDGTVSFHANNGSAGVPFASTATVADVLGTAVPGGSGLAVDDIDHDGDPDVLVADDVGRIWAFRNDGAWVFTLVSKVYGGTAAGFAPQLTITSADFDGDGDSDLICGFEGGGLMYLRNPDEHLLVAPPSATVLAGATLGLSATNASGSVLWSFVTNRSGGTLQATTGVYTAGASAGVVDVVEALAPDGTLGRSYLNVIGADEVSRLGTAIVIAGGRSLDDAVWPMTDYLGDLAFNTLLYRGYSKSNLQYLSFQPAQDVDGNGALDDVDGSSAATNVAHVFTNWVGRADRLFVYLVDHGSDVAGEGYFRLNGTDHLTAVQLDAWLDAIQNTYTTEVTVVMDFCYSGSFLDELAYTGTAKRIVMASARADQLTYFLAGGMVSFSGVFFGSILQGADLEQSFLNAAGAMDIHQKAQLDDTGDGLYQPGIDGSYSQSNTVGASFVVGRDIPQIGRVAPDQTLATGTTANVWAADVASTYPIDRVWCSVVAPGHQPNTNVGIPVIDIPQADLAWNGEQVRHEATLNGLGEAGTYAVIYQARDIWGGVSLPRQGHIVQNGLDERAVLVLAGPTNLPRWTSMNLAAAQVYRTLRARRISAERIRCLSAGTATDLDGDGSIDVSGSVSLANLAGAITNWASGSAGLTVYVLGLDYAGGCRLTETETLTAGALGTWFDAYQISNRAVNVVLDFPSAGAFLPALIPPAGRERIAIAATSATGPALFDSSGQVSFSAFFMAEVFQGRSIGVAFARARDAIRQSGKIGQQRALLDDNGNGIGEKSDGSLAAQRYIGTAFVTGDDAPYIGSVTPMMIVATGGVVTVWAADALDVDGISNVYAFVTTPSADGTNDLPRTNFVFNAALGRYEANWMLDKAGTYAFTIFAQDTLGNLSPPIQTLVLTPDAYEVDDTAGQAKAFDPGEVQTHNFHGSNDEDWVMFFAPTGAAFEITATQLSTNSDVKLEVFYLQPDGTLSNLDLSADDYGRGQDEQEYIALDLIADTNLLPGLYLVRVSNADLDGMGWGLDSEYDLSIYVPVGAGKLTVVAADKLHVGVSPPGAVAYVDGGNPKSFNGAQTVVYQGLSPGFHNVQVTVPAGYVAEEDPIAAGQVQNPSSVLYGNPKNKQVVDLSWQTVVFQFVPTITATGTIRDAITGEFLEGVSLRWLAKNGAIAGLIYTQYPNASAYGTPWLTRPDGGFPADVKLPAVSLDLLMYKAGYSNFNAVGAIIDPPAGHHTPFGDVFLQPVDVNGNRIADTWETLYFGGLTSSTNDPDADGQNNRAEYISGTSPTNAASVFRSDAAAGTNGITLSWPAAPARIYRIMKTESLVPGVWTLAAGPWTNTAASTMSWSDATATTGRMYRIEVNTR